MARSADPELRQWWRELIDSFDATRESVAEFCDRHEVSTASFYAWRRKLAKASTSAGSGIRLTPGRPRDIPPTTTTGDPAQVPEERQAEAAAFLPVQIINSQEPGCLRVHLSGGMSVELPAGQRQLLLDLVTHLRGHAGNDVSEANA